MLLPRFPLSFLPVVVLALLAVPNARAQTSHAFVIAGADEGYGVNECLLQAGECGKVIADAWCESHGAGEALSFGPRNPVSNASVGGAEASETAFVVTCAD